MAQLCPAKSTIVPFKKQMYSSGSIILSYKDDKCICVSIHAPTRGATNVQSGLFKSQTVSIHAPTRGATHTVARHRAKFSVSIHAPTRGATCPTRLLSSATASFNPRTHEGCDLIYIISFVMMEVSIHAPTRGATEKLRTSHTLRKVSIHAPTRGATGYYDNYTFTAKVSIHAPTRGATWRSAQMQGD